MKNTIVIPRASALALKSHLLQNELEQGAFLFARPDAGAASLRLVVEAMYLVPALGWEVQMEVYLQMRDSERAKIMKMARDKNLAAIDCHSHPWAGKDVWFSPSDMRGMTEFAQYAWWKLDGKPFAAMVWAEQSVDAVIWHSGSSESERVHEIRIDGDPPQILIPTGSRFRRGRERRRFAAYA